MRNSNFLLLHFVACENLPVCTAYRYVTYVMQLRMPLYSHSHCSWIVMLRWSVCHSIDENFSWIWKTFIYLLFYIFLFTIIHLMKISPYVYFRIPMLSPLNTRYRHSFIWSDKLFSYTSHSFALDTGLRYLVSALVVMIIFMLHWYIS